MGWRLKPESDERALIAALRALVEAEASQDPGHTADRKRGGILDRTTFCDGHHIGTGTLSPRSTPHQGRHEC
jgi:hypothetical protein